MALTLKLTGALAACCLCYTFTSSAIGAEDSPASTRNNGVNMYQAQPVASGNIAAAGDCKPASDSIAENPSPDAAPCERTPSAPADSRTSAGTLTVQPLPLSDRHWNVAQEFNAVQEQQRAIPPLQQVPGIALK